MFFQSSSLVKNCLDSKYLSGKHFQRHGPLFLFLGHRLAERRGVLSRGCKQGAWLQVTEHVMCSMDSILCLVHSRPQRPRSFSRPLARGPFLERPGNLTGPKSYFEIKFSRKVVLFRANIKLVLSCQYANYLISTVN